MTLEHHALLITRGKDEGQAVAFQALGIADYTEADPDVHILSYAHFGIDEARLLKQTAANMPVRAPKRSFIVYTEAMTGEAQNALLKLFEDPPATARFVLIMPRADALLPTLRSRLFYVEGMAQRDTAIAEAFIALPYDERLAEVAARAKAKDDSWADALMSGLERLIGDQGRSELRDILPDVLFIRQYLGRRGASMKMLLEHLAVSL